MADTPYEDDDLEVDDFEARLMIGGKIMEMIERLTPMNAITPGCLATYAFELDGQTFKITLAVAGD